MQVDRFTRSDHLLVITQLNRKISAKKAKPLFKELDLETNALIQQFNQRKFNRCPWTTSLALITLVVAVVLFSLYTQMSRKSIALSAIGLAMTTGVITFSILSCINASLEREKTKAITL